MHEADFEVKGLSPLPLQSVQSKHSPDVFLCTPIIKIFNDCVILSKTGKDCIEMGYGKKLKNLLDEKGMTVKELARKTGIAPTTLYFIIQRDAAIRFDTVLRISNVLDTRHSYQFHLQGQTILMMTWKRCQSFPPIKSG